MQTTSTIATAQANERKARGESTIDRAKNRHAQIKYFRSTAMSALLDAATHAEKAMTQSARIVVCFLGMAKLNAVRLLTPALVAAGGEDLSAARNDALDALFGTTFEHDKSDAKEERDPDSVARTRVEREIAVNALKVASMIAATNNALDVSEFKQGVNPKGAFILNTPAALKLGVKNVQEGAKQAILPFTAMQRLASTYLGSKKVQASPITAAAKKLATLVGASKRKLTKEELAAIVACHAKLGEIIAKQRKAEQPAANKDQTETIASHKRKLAAAGLADVANPKPAVAA